MSIQNICIFGMGGVGGYFGGQIAHTPHPHHVTFIARGKHLDEIRAKGLILNTATASGLVCRPDNATDTIDKIEPPDLCLISVKSYDLENALMRLQNKIHDHTVILPLLNGIDIYERVRGIIKNGIVLPACAYVNSHIEGPGVVTQKGPQGRILLGPDPQYPEFVPDDLLSLLGKSGVDCVWFDDPYPAIWEKYMFIAGYGLIGAYSRKNMGQIINDYDLWEQLRDIMAEIAEIARLKGITLPVDIVKRSMDKAYAFPKDTRTSYQRDIETKRAQNEGDLFGGTLTRLSKSLGIRTPAVSSVYASIQRKS